MARHTHRESSPLDNEIGTIYKQGGLSLALGYPAPYRVGASSLGFQHVYGMLNRMPDVACARFFMPERGPVPSPLPALETGRPVADMDAILFSVACEQELLELVRLLNGIGVAPLAAERRPTDPPVIMGGPLTTVDPRLLAPLSDLVVVGSAEPLLPPITAALRGAVRDKAAFLQAVAGAHPGLYVPALGPLVWPEDVSIPETPASAVTWSPDAEFRNLFLVEATRGCRRGCAFCTLSRFSTRTPRFHPYALERILAAVPDAAPGVGLVGAAVTDHPEIEALVAALADQGKRVSLSSIRADRLTPELAALLRRTGGRTITLAADGASEQVRRRVRKGILEQHLIQAVETARAAGFQALKIYSMVGLPGEADADILEYAALLNTLSRRIKVSTTVQAFVPKPATPLADAPMAPLATVTERLALLRRAVKGRIRVLPTSPKWSWIDWKLAHAGEKGALVAVDAAREGGNFAAWKRAVHRHLGPAKE